MTTLRKLLSGAKNWLALTLAQAVAVIAIQHLGYGTYLARLRSVLVQDALKRTTGEPYPHGAAEAIAGGPGPCRGSPRMAEAAGLGTVMRRGGAAIARR
jgi:hypothetical protein